MCGICFSIRSSASFSTTGPSPSSPSASLAPLPSSPAGSSAAASPSSDRTDGPEFGIALPDGSKPPPSTVLDHNDVWDAMCSSVASRGPDWQGSHTQLVQPATQQFAYELRFHGAVLHMRGPDGLVTRQPFVGDEGDVFLWNGEVFDGLEVGKDENDGRKLFDRIREEGPTNFFAAIRDIEGPYAFVYYQAATERIYFARDPLGRRSLLIHKPTAVSSALLLSSCALSVDHALSEWEEVSCDAIHCYHLRDLKGKSWLVDRHRGLTSYPRYPKSLGISDDTLIYPFDRLLTTVPTPNMLLPIDPIRDTPVPTAQLNIAIQSLLAELKESVRRRVVNIPTALGMDGSLGKAKVGVLFSGGIDCTMVALLADMSLPEGEPIDLINVAFENPRVLQAAASQAKNLALAKQRKQKPKAKQQSNNASSPGEDILPGSLDAMELDPSSSKPSTRSSSPQPNVPAWDADIRPVITSTAPSPNLFASSSSSPSSAATPSTQTDSSEDRAEVYEVPDRLTGRESWRELRRLRPGRRWNFVEVDVPYDEMRAHRAKVIELIRPQRTVMDLSISLAFYFAARGRGTVEGGSGDEGERVAYESTARVLLSGLGADELLGGYSRHRKAWNKAEGGDWAGLIAEMQLDLDRLGTRNLGRDDRIISHHGKEARYPFLAGSVIDLCARTPIWLKVDPRLPEGRGEKMLLRLLAQRLGLRTAAELKKRAIHFGARTAKMEAGSGGVTGDDLIVE